VCVRETASDIADAVVIATAFNDATVRELEAKIVRRLGPL